MAYGSIISKLVCASKRFYLWILFFNQTSQKIAQGSNDNFNLTIYLKMTSNIELKIKLLPKSYLEVTQKFRIMIWNDWFRNSIKSNNLFKIKIINISCIWCLVIRNEMSHFKKSINNHQNKIFVFWVWGIPTTKFMLASFQKEFGTRSEAYKHVFVHDSLLCNRLHNNQQDE